VKLITDKFEGMNASDERLKDIKLALITAQCSRSGVADPVKFIVSEGEGTAAASERRRIQTVSRRPPDTF